MASLADVTVEKRGSARALPRVARIVALGATLAAMTLLHLVRQRWDHQLALARRACANAQRRSVNVLVSPAPPRVWYATIPCRRL